MLAEAGRMRTPRAEREAPKAIASDIEGQALRAVSIGFAETFLPVAFQSSLMNGALEGYGRLSSQAL